jgi:hypothetical protein
MPTQTSLDLRGEGLRALWRRLPERCRSKAIALFAQLIARAAQSTPNPSRSRNRGFPQPPPQIRTSGFPASGSCLR